MGASPVAVWFIDGLSADMLRATQGQEGLDDLLGFLRIMGGFAELLAFVTCL
jgi:hypothetical protein